MQYTTVNRRAAGEPVPLGMSHSACVFKRVSDVILAIVGLILSAPLWLAIYLALKYQGEGSVIYRQERIGLGGRPFQILKFRSMKVQNESDEKKAWTVKDDPRVTGIGKFIRKTSLDELPQLFNILKGEMSIVGPRPDLPEHIRMYTKYEKRKLEVKAEISKVPIKISVISVFFFVPLVLLIILAPVLIGYLGG